MPRFGSVSMALAFVLMAGCSTPYSTPTLDQPPESSAAPFPGVADVLKDGPTRIVWVHGMCDHDDAWARDRNSVLISALGANPSNTPRRFQVEPGIDKPYRLTYSQNVNGKELETNFLIWSPVSEEFKGRLLYDDSISDGGAFPYKRARLNQTLKGTLINRCLIDAVVYSGPNGDVIRSWMKYEVCAALGGVYNRSRCNFTRPSPPQTIFIAESLGSKLLADALAGIWNSTPDALRSETASRLSQVQLVYLLANQIPLLNAADGKSNVINAVASEDDPSFSGGLGVLAEARGEISSRATAAALRPLHLIAFTDPNDLLSYRLLPREGVTVVNVIVSNDPTYFGVVERPDFAHCGYKWNNDVVGILVNGYDGRRVQTVPIKLEKTCGLAH